MDALSIVAAVAVGSVVTGAMILPCQHFREQLGNGLLIVFGGLLIALFVGEHIYGKIWLAEPNPYILASEIAMSIGIVILGIERMWSDWKQNKGAGDEVDE